VLQNETLVTKLAQAQPLSTYPNTYDSSNVTKPPDVRSLRNIHESRAASGGESEKWDPKQEENDGRVTYRAQALAQPNFQSRCPPEPHPDLPSKTINSTKAQPHPLSPPNNFNLPVRSPPVAFGHRPYLSFIPSLSLPPIPHISTPLPRFPLLTGQTNSLINLHLLSPVRDGKLSSCRFLSRSYCSRVTS